MSRSKYYRNRFARLSAMTVSELEEEIYRCAEEEKTFKGRYAKARRYCRQAKEEAMEEYERRTGHPFEFDNRGAEKYLEKENNTSISDGTSKESHIPSYLSKHSPKIMYIELKSHSGGHDDSGPARIGRVTFSKSGKTLYYKGRRFQSTKGQGICSNYYDIDTGDEYWISGPKKNGQDRHRCGAGPVEIDEDVREEYWVSIRGIPKNKDKETT